MQPNFWSIVLSKKLEIEVVLKKTRSEQHNIYFFLTKIELKLGEQYMYKYFCIKKAASAIIFKSTGTLKSKAQKNITDDFECTFLPIFCAFFFSFLACKKIRRLTDEMPATSAFL